MTRFPHDRFAKDYLKELLTGLGEVKTNRKVAGETQEIDVWFTPSAAATSDPQILGILGRMASTPALFEPFRNPVTSSQIRSCASKLFQVHAEIERQAKRKTPLINETELAKLWIITPTASRNIIEKFRGIADEENWLRGIYFLGEGWKTALVVVHQLPRTPETLWLRILGKGTVQRQAVEELTALPEGSRLRVSALELLYNLRLNLEANRDLQSEDRELVMQLSPLYVEQMNAAVRTGVQQGERLVVENLLSVRFGGLDNELRSTIEPLLELPPQEFTRLLLQLSRDELLERFQR